MAVDDIGIVVNPLIVEGQVHGGIAQGIAQALYEEAVYDDDGNLVTTTLVDYLVPSASDLPSYVTDRTESPGRQPAGRQGRRRGRDDRLDPAVVNAIVDALRRSGSVTSPCPAPRADLARHPDTRGAPGQPPSGMPLGKAIRPRATARRGPGSDEAQQTGGAA